MPKYNIFDYETSEFVGESEQQESLDLNLGDRFTLEGERKRVMKQTIRIDTEDRDIYVEDYKESE